MPPAPPPPRLAVPPVPPPPPPPTTSTSTSLTPAGASKLVVPTDVNASTTYVTGIGACVTVTLPATYVAPGGSTSVRNTPVCATVPVFASAIS